MKLDMRFDQSLSEHVAGAPIESSPPLNPIDGRAGARFPVAPTCAAQLVGTSFGVLGGPHR